MQGTLWGALIGIVIAGVDASVTSDHPMTEAAKQHFADALKYWMFVCLTAGILIDGWW
jgi:hypothetical protein